MLALTTCSKAPTFGVQKEWSSVSALTISTILADTRLGVNALLDLLVLISEMFSLFHHRRDLFLDGLLSLVMVIIHPFLTFCPRHPP